MLKFFEACENRWYLVAGESTLQLEYVPIAPAGYKTLFAQGTCGTFTGFHGGQS